MGYRFAELSRGPRKYWLQNSYEDFPGDTVDRNLSCQGRGQRFDLSSRKIPYAAGQLSPWATTMESVL